MSDDKTKDLQPELPEAVEPKELDRDEKRAELEAEGKKLDKRIDELNGKIAKLRRDKDALVAEKDECILALDKLRLSPAEELQRHIRVQQEARAERNANIAAAAKAISAAGIPTPPAPSALDAAMKTRPPGGRR